MKVLWNHPRTGQTYETEPINILKDGSIDVRSPVRPFEIVNLDFDHYYQIEGWVQCFILGIHPDEPIPYEVVDLERSAQDPTEPFPDSDLGPYLEELREVLERLTGASIGRVYSVNDDGVIISEPK